MTNYNDWDRKASELCKATDEEEEKAKAENDKALGLEGGPQGPPVARAREQRQQMDGHSDGRRQFIAEQQAKELVITHAEGSQDPIVVDADQAREKAVRLRGSKDATYEFPEGLVVLKLFLERCRNVTVRLGCTVKTSFLECNHCSDIEVLAEQPLATVQVDECTEGPVRIVYVEPENVGTIYHQNCPALEISVPSCQPKRIGRKGGAQLVTSFSACGEAATEEVVRGEKEFPVQLGQTRGAMVEPEVEKPPSSEEARARAEEKRSEGNDAFKASDFLQAAVYYTEAINICEDLHLAWANRAACFLKTGQPEKALADAARCTELAPEYAKGWFRKGMALHALERFGAAIPAFCEAERLEPKNPQIPDAIKMAQMMCRTKGPGESSA